MKRRGETREGADLLSSSSVVRRGEGTEAVQGRGPHEGGFSIGGGAGS